MKGKNYLTSGQIINNISNIMKKSVGYGKSTIDSGSRVINYVVATDAIRQLEQFLGQFKKCRRHFMIFGLEFQTTALM